MNALVPAHATGLAFSEVERLAVSIARSGLFGIKTPDQAMALMMIAHAEGRHPALAARDYDIIQGRPSKKAEAMLRDFLEAGGKVEWHKLDDTVADATFVHPQGGKVRIAWDMARAAKAGLTGKDMYKKFPRQMLRSRAISEGVRTVWPGATSGMYVPEEVATTIEHDLEQPALTRREQINAEVPLADPPEPKRMTLREWLDDFEARCGAATTEDEANAILKEERVLRLDDPELNINASARERALRIRQEMVARIWPQPPAEEGETTEEMFPEATTA
jgi:hypothetical protein